MKITFLGTCSGTEPMPGLHHCSFVIERGERLYWFDAGECCSYTAHVGGVDLAAVEAVFISHTHMDHIGGLASLLWTMRKLCSRSQSTAERLEGRTIKIFIPNLDVWDGIMKTLRGTEGGFGIKFGLEACEYGDGTVYDEDGVRVAAAHNLHLGEPEAGQPWRSFSLRFEADGRSVAYSGDVRSIADFAALIDGCSLLLMETGHHKVEDVCCYLRDSGLAIGRLGFIHHGRGILDDPAGELAKAQSILGDRVFIAEDGAELEL